MSISIRKFSPLGSYDSIAKLSRAESAEIFSKKYAERSQVKTSMIEEERSKRMLKEKRRRENIKKWQGKLAKSPFKVNLVADNERLDEVRFHFLYISSLFQSFNISHQSGKSCANAGRNKTN